MSGTEGLSVAPKEVTSREAEKGQHEGQGSLRVVSYGGGVQSTALLALAAQGRIDFPTFLFANVGDDSEHPATLRYVREVAMPYAEQHGITVHVLDRHRRDGSVETLMGRLTRPGSRSLPIPVRMSDTGPPVGRACTMDFKIRVIAKWLRAHGVSEANKATVAIGISLDEIHRASTRRPNPYEDVVYPLLDIPAGVSGLQLDRSGCMTVIREAGLPVPPKSSCFFCPFHRPSTWAEMARDEPDLFERSAQLEDLLNDRRRMLNRGPVFLTRFGVPLREAIIPAQDMLAFDDDDEAHCDGGVCFT